MEKKKIKQNCSTCLYFDDLLCDRYGKIVDMENNKGIKKCYICKEKENTNNGPDIHRSKNGTR